jgi:drug/metabolite transporter (DMT)-like permease
LRLFLLVAVTMVAFAANSLLNRVAVGAGAAGPAEFAAIRVVSGALALWLFAGLAGQAVRLTEAARILPALMLTLYLLGFSFAYLTLDAGIGALILFGCVQVTMFAGSLVAGERPPALRWLGMTAGLLGLGLLVWPAGVVRADPLGTVLMACAGIGWGVYSLRGRGSRAPIADTAASFLLASPLVLAGWFLSGAAGGIAPPGVALAVVSGVVTSGMGYALWYTVLPRLEASVAALAQLTVPVIAVAGGVTLLGESVGVKTVLSAALVLGGVAVGILGGHPRRR